MTLYTKQVWLVGVTGGTKISAMRLNRLEGGLELTAQEVTALQQAFAELDLGSLPSVDLSVPPVDGQPLVWHAGSSKFRPGAASVDASSDVDLSGIADGQTLVWNAGVGKLLPGAFSAVDELGDLSDVDFETNPPLVGSVPQFDGTKWVPYVLPVAPARTYTFQKEGALATGVGALRVYNDDGVARTIQSVRATVGTPPGSGEAIIDVNVGGSSIFTSGGRPRPNPTQKVTPNIANWPDGSFLTVDIDAIGSGTPPQNLTVTVTYR